MAAAPTDVIAPIRQFIDGFNKARHDRIRRLRSRQHHHRRRVLSPPLDRPQRRSANGLPTMTNTQLPQVSPKDLSSTALPRAPKSKVISPTSSSPPFISTRRHGKAFTEEGHATCVLHVEKEWMEDAQLDMVRRQAPSGKVTFRTEQHFSKTNTVIVEARPVRKPQARYTIFPMSDFIPKAAEIKTRGLSPKAQKLHGGT